jgi:hypothetical protein
VDAVAVWAVGVGFEEVEGVVLGGEAARVREVVGEAVKAEGAGDGVSGIVEKDVTEGFGVGCDFAAEAVGMRAGGKGHPVRC